MAIQELSVKQVEQVSGGGLIEAGYATGATTSAAVGFGLFGPVGAVGAFAAFTLGFGGALGVQYFSRNRF
jgi:hypothetical protein